MARWFWIYDENGFQGIDCLTVVEEKRLAGQGVTLIRMTDEEFKRMFTAREDKRETVPGFGSKRWN